MRDNLIRLSDLPAGQAGLVADLAGGHAASGRLAAMGVVPGQTVRVLRNDGAGPLLLAVGGSRLAIGRGLAGKVLLSESSSSAAR